MISEPRPAIGVTMVVTGAAFFGLNATVSKLALSTGLDSPQLTTIRATGAALGLFLLTAITRPSRLKIARHEWPLLIVYGLAGFFVVPMLYFIAISRLPVGVGVLLEYTAPLLLALWVRFVQRRPVRPRLWIGLIASLVGLAGVAELARLGPGLGVGFDTHLRLDGLGVAAALTAACLLVSYYLLGERGVRTRDPTSLTAYAFGISALAGAVVRPWWNFDFGRFGRTGEHGFPVWLLVTYIVGGGSIVPYFLFSAALRHIPATSVGIIGMLEPVFAAAIAWLALGEHLNTGQLAGGVLILIGVTLAETARVRKAGPDAHATETARVRRTEPPQLFRTGETTEGRAAERAASRSGAVAGGSHPASTCAPRASPTPDPPA